MRNVSSVEIAFHIDSIGGESPYWDAAAGEFWWLDIHGQRINRGLASGAVESTAIERFAGSLTRVEGRASFLTAGEHGFAELGPGWLREYPIPYEQDKPDNLLNDGKADSRGRMWVGSRTRTAGSRDGRIHRLDADGTVTTFDGDFEISNGMGWSPDERTFYAVDSIVSVVYAYDFDVEAGTISGRRVFADIPYDVGLPDGLAVDAEGGVWLALCFGGAVHRYAPDGSLDLVVELPVKAVTSVAFGGADLSTLYITTGRLREIPMVLERGLVPTEHQPGAGDVYAYASEVPGLPMYRWRPAD